MDHTCTGANTATVGPRTNQQALQRSSLQMSAGCSSSQSHQIRYIVFSRWGNSLSCHEMRQRNQDGEGRDCWRTARERERLRARFHIRERVATNDEESTDETQSSMAIAVEYDPTTWPLVAQYITYIKAGDRSKFSLSVVDRQFDLISSKIPIDLLFRTKSTDIAEGWSLAEHSFHLCIARFGMEYAKTLQNYMKSLQSFTLIEYAAWMGKYSIVGALLLAGVNPCRRGRREVSTMEETRDDIDWSVPMGIRVTKFFFDCFPVLLSTYIVKRVVELRLDGWLHEMSAGTTHAEHCMNCQKFDNMEDALYFATCDHWICGICFWNDIVENLDHRGDWNDVVACPYCTESGNRSKFDDDLGVWGKLTPTEKRIKSKAMCNELPEDRNALKATAGKKKKPSEQDHWASSWYQAVLPSLGSTRNVRRDKFFSFVERNAVHYVRGCLYAGVDVDWTNEYGQTALYIGAWRGFAAIVRSLLLFGADVQQPANDGSTAIEVAALLGDEHLQKLLGQEDAEVFGELDGAPSNFFAPARNINTSPTTYTTLISEVAAHPGSGSYMIDHTVSDQEIAWLLSLHSRIPVHITQKSKAGLCSERSYFCDVAGTVQRKLVSAIRTSGLVSRKDYLEVFAHMRFLDYNVPGTTLNPHVDICRIGPRSGRRSTHTFILYLTECEHGGETSLLEDISGDGRSKVLARISPRRGRLLLFPHACPHEGNGVVDVPKLLLRGEICIGGAQL